MKNSGWSLVTSGWSLAWSPRISRPKNPQIAKRKSHKWPNKRVKNSQISLAILKNADTIDSIKVKDTVFKMVLTTAGACAYHRKDGILIVPIEKLIGKNL